MHRCLAVIACAGIALVPAFTVHAQDVSELVNLFRPLDPHAGAVLHGACEAARKDGFWKLLLALEGERLLESRLRGEARLSARSNSVPDPFEEKEGSSNVTVNTDNTHTLDVGLTLRRGGYPGEFKFDAGVNLRFNEKRDDEDTFEEDVSRFEMAYDWYVHENVELYGFASRNVNSFMAVDQRYEIGVGVVYEGSLFGQFSDLANKQNDTLKKWQDKKLEGLDRELEALDQEVAGESSAPTVPKAPSWYQCRRVLLRQAQLRELRETLPNNAELFVRELTDTEIEAPLTGGDQELVQALRDVVETARIAHHKRTRTLRWAVLVGVQRELERVVLKHGETEFVLPDRTDRIVLRPTLEWRPNTRWEFVAHPYWKWAIRPREAQRVEIDENGTATLPVNDQGDPVLETDLRFDLETHIGFRVSGTGFGEPGNTQIRLVYTRTEDRTPQFEVVEGNRATILTAPRRHDVLALLVTVGW